MSRFFTNPQDREPIYEFDPESVVLNPDGTPRQPNVVYIRPRMNIGTKNKVQGAMFKLDAQGKTLELDIGANLTALLQYNIIDWDGPDFRDKRGRKIPCTPENIALLVDDPFFARVAEAIGERNKPLESPDPKSSDSSGSISDGAGSSSTPASSANPSDDTTPIWSLPSATTGPQTKLIDVTPTT